MVVRHSEHNDSTDSFFADQQPTVQSVRDLNPNLQSIDEEAVNRRHRSKRNSAISVQSNRSQSRYSVTLPASPRLSVEASHSDGKVDTERLSRLRAEQHFLKYHVISIGKNQMYLTTNPDIKHLYCRTGPGYFVELLLPKASSKYRSQRDAGFRLVFKRQNYQDLDNEAHLKDPGECVVVTKDSKEDGGQYNVVAVLVNDLNGTTRPDPVTVKCRAEEVQIPELMALLERDSDNSELQRLVPSFHRYNFDYEGVVWSVGSNPVAKQKTLNRLKINNDMFKLTGKQNVYFSRANEAAAGVSKRTSLARSLRLSGHAQPDSLRDDDVLALFRPHEKRFKKKLLKTLNTTSSSEKPAESAADQYNYIETDKQYFTPGDGLTQPNPKDDSPNANKIGWLTIYESESTVAMWELVLGLTFAVGFDRVIDEYVSE